MIQVKLFQGLYNTVQAQIDAYLVEIDKIRQVAEARFELSSVIDEDDDIIVPYWRCGKSWRRVSTRPSTTNRQEKTP